MTFLLLALVGLAAGWVDSIAGGGGLLSLPTLLLVGVPPHVALGTNKLQSICGTSVASFKYGRGGHLDGRLLLASVPLVLVGSALGSRSVLFVSPGAVKGALIPVFVGIGIYLAVQRDTGARARPELRTRLRFAATLTLAAVIGFYDGFFGPGTGVFFFLVLVGGIGCDALTATGSTKVLNGSTNLAALLVFLATGRVDLRLGLLMGGANALGGWIGSGMAIHRGHRFIRLVVVAVVLGISAKLAWDHWLGSGWS